MAKLHIASHPQQDLHLKNVLIFHLPVAVSCLAGNGDKIPFVRVKFDLGNLEALLRFLSEAMKNCELLCCLAHCKSASSFLS